MSGEKGRGRDGGEKVPYDRLISPVIKLFRE